MPASTDNAATQEYRKRRQKLLKMLGQSVGVIFAGDGSPPLLGKWRADANFRYLTGIDAEAGAAVLFDPTASDDKRRIVLFLRPLNPEMERWDGYRDPINAALKARHGFDSVMRVGSLPTLLTAAARRSKSLTCLHPLSVYPAEASTDLMTFRKVAERVPGVRIEDGSQILPTLRIVKSPEELLLMRRAIDATAAGFAAAVTMIRPGVNEADIMRTLEDNFRAAGGTGLAYNSIVGSGLNGTVLHYMDNAAVVQDDDLIVIDAGAEYQGYAADVTRTYPASGKFTREQREAYETVLAAQTAAIAATKVGARMSDIDAAARQVIDKAGFGDTFIHGIGHPLGMEVHDVSPDAPLPAGAVVTIEPGVYLPERKLGIRIEDDILLKPRGNENLTRMIPKTVKEIEQLMRR